MIWAIALLLFLLAVAAVLRVRRRRAGNWIAVDGSNVLYWEGNTPSLASVRHVIGALRSEGYDPVVWFDANVGYLVSDRYMGPDRLAELIGVPRRYVFVAAKGTPADPLLLAGAEKLGARVVTNDRFRDWENAFPRIREDGFLVRGFICADEVGLEWSKS